VASCPGQGPWHLLVGRLAEAWIPDAARAERRRGRRAHDLVGVVAHGGARLGRADRHRDHEAGGPVAAHRARGGAHGRAGGEAVVDQDDDLAGELERRAIVAVEPLAAGRGRGPRGGPPPPARPPAGGGPPPPPPAPPAPPRAP